VNIKTKIITGLLAGWLTSCCAESVSDDFDWGAGVTGRESVSSGTSINGIQTQTDGKTWDLVNGTAQFSGTAGTGNGSLTLTGNNAAIRVDCTPSGTVVVSAQGSISFPDSGVRGFWIGLQTASPDGNLLNNQAADNLHVQLAPGGTLRMKAVVDGVTDNVNSSVVFSDGDTVKLVILVDLENKTASLTAENLTQGETGSCSVSWSGVPDWQAFVVNQTGDSTLILDSVSVSPPAQLSLLVVTSP
jgi:hypothetical protein